MIQPLCFPPLRRRSESSIDCRHCRPLLTWRVVSPADRDASRKNSLGNCPHPLAPATFAHYQVPDQRFVPVSTAAVSIRSLPPIEVGGTVARTGFHVQDHVAAGYCLQMCDSTDLVEVWCESQDDITLFWNIGAIEDVEFVQVKSDQLDQLWSIALLLSKDGSMSKSAAGDGVSKKKPARCILEKSLQNDRGCEKSRFRIVTCRPVMEELKLLTLPLTSPHRAPTTAEFLNLVSRVTEKLGSFRSPNDNGCEYWVQHTHWVVIHAVRSIENDNILKVMQIAQSHGIVLLVGQARAVYEHILTRVHTAGLADWKTEREKKEIRRADFINWFARASHDAAHPGNGRAGKALHDKLKDANAADDLIESAGSMRLKYLSGLYTPKYSDPNLRDTIEGEIEARLMRLRAQLDTRFRGSGN
jgi:hypothetical protein